MGKKGGWISAVKKVLSPEPKEEKDKDFKTHKSKRKWFGKHKSQDLDSPSPKTALAVVAPPSPIEEVKLVEVENEQNKHACSSPEVVRLTIAARYSGKSKKEIAAINIQTAFRGYKARKALRAMRGLVRLKSLIEGQSVKRQAITALQCMQTIARLQSQIQSRRVRISEENHVLERQLQQKREKELEKLSASYGEDWDARVHSKEKIEANLQSRQEAAIKRERALAYAYSHQQTWKNSSKPESPTFMDPNNPQWGWSWLERWMAARPWENRTTVNKELNSDRASIKSGSVNEITKPHSILHPKKIPRPRSHQSPSTPHPKTPTTSMLMNKAKSASTNGRGYGSDDASRRTASGQSERHRRHSISGSLTKVKSRLPNPLGSEQNGKAEKGSSMGSAKKRLSFTSAPAGPRWHSGPPKVESGSIKGH